MLRRKHIEKEGQRAGERERERNEEWEKQVRKRELQKLDGTA